MNRDISRNFRLSVPLEAVSAALSVSHRLRDLKECLSRVRQAGRLPVNQPQFAMHFQFLHGNAHQFTARDLVFNADFGQECDAAAHGNKSFNRLQRWQLDSHVQGCVVLLEGLNNLLTIG